MKNSFWLSLLYYRKGDIHSFLGFTMFNIHRLLGERQHVHKSLLCRIIRPIRSRIAETFGEEKNALQSWERIGSHTTGAATAKMVELSYKLLPHPHYSLNLALYDFFCFLAWKIYSPGRNLSRTMRLLAPEWSVGEKCFQQIWRT